MDGEESIAMALIKDSESNSAMRNPQEFKYDNERSFLITNDDKEKSNGSSKTLANSYRSLLAISEDSKEYPNTQDINRSHYMENTTTWLTTLIHVIKGNIGIGALSLPFAMMNSGIVVGPVLLLVTASIAVHCMHLLVQCNHTFLNRTKSLNLGYAQIAEMSIALYYPKARHLGSMIVNILLVITQLGFCCVYFIFVSESLKQIFDDTIQLDVRTWIAILILPTVLLSFIRTLKLLAVISMVSNILYFSGVFCILIYASDNMQSPETLPKFTGLATVPLAYGAIVFSLEGIGVILPLENVMASPRHFSCVLSIGMGVVVLVYLLLSILGFSSCGMHCLGSFTLNLPNTPYYAAVKGTLAIAIFFTYFIQFYVPMTIIIPSVQEKLDQKYSSLADYGIRTFFVCVTAVLAICVPLLGDMISLVGAVGCTALEIIFPAIIHILTFSYDNSLCTSSLIKNIILIVFGFLGAVSGLYASIIDMIWNIQHPGVPQGAVLFNSSHVSL